MNKHRIALNIAFTILMIASTFLPLANTQAAYPSAQIAKTNFGINQLPPFAPGVVLVGLKQGVTAGMGVHGVETTSLSLNKVLAQFGVRDIEPVFPIAGRSPFTVNAIGTGVDLSRIYRLRFSPDANVLQIVQGLSKQPAVEYAEPDYLAHIITTPNDPEYPNQWGLEKINAPAAWDVVTGTTDVVIAVVDAGIDATHSDLSGQLWQNPGEIAGNGIDDDNNGYIDDIHGWNFVNNNADLSDNTGHGTEVAGITAAATNNSVGIVGMCWQCRLMIVKVVQPGGVANYSDIAAGVVYAAQKGAKVINISLGGSSDSITLKTAIANAAQTAVIVAGAGNDNSSAPFYPAAYDDYVLAVAGTSQTDAKVGTSNYGKWVDVCAPGENIRTTFVGGGYGNASGTSLAAAFVSGLAGLLRSQNPTWSANLTRAQIINTTDNIDSANPGYVGQLGSGRINAHKAVTTAATPQLSIASYTVNGTQNGNVNPGTTVNLIVTIRNNWADATNVVGTLTTGDPYVSITNGTSSFGNIPALTTGSNANAFIFSVSGSAPPGHNIPFTLNLSANSGMYTINLSFTVPTQKGTQYVGGIITSNQTWTRDKIYVVTGNILVPNGVTLTIEPGTVISYADKAFIQIDGTLIASGTVSSPIVFMGGGCGIRFTDTSQDYAPSTGTGSVIAYTRIGQIPQDGCYGHAAIEVNNASPLIMHNVINPSGTNEASYCCVTGIVAYNTASTISYNEIYGAGYIALSASGNPTVEHNIIRNSGYSQNCVVSINGGVFRNNVLRNNSYGELALCPSNTLIEGNLLYENGNTAIRLGSGSIIRYNTFLRYGVGIFIGGYMTTTITNNNFLDNFTGGDEWGGGCHYNHYNILVTNGCCGVYCGSDNYPTSPFTITAQNNYWNSTEPNQISGWIRDRNDDFTVYGTVDYSNFLPQPDPTAPGFLYDLALSPESPIGIQQATFILTFSKPMDQSINPTVTFGATPPYTDYVVIDNAQWVTDRVWRATYDITSLVPRGTYTISVSGARGMDGMEIPTDTRFSFVVDYAGQITDQTPPNTPLVIAGGKQGDPSTVEAIWWANDPDSSITGYRYAIGSAPGATDIVNWTTISNNSFTRSGLGLIEGRQYWVSVQARNIGGLWSASGYSAFVAGQPLRRVFLPLVLKGR